MTLIWTELLVNVLFHNCNLNIRSKTKSQGGYIKRPGWQGKFLLLFNLVTCISREQVAGILPVTVSLKFSSRAAHTGCLLPNKSGFIPIQLCQGIHCQALGEKPKKPKNIYQCLTVGAKVPQHIWGFQDGLQARLQGHMVRIASLFPRWLRFH